MLNNLYTLVAAVKSGWTARRQGQALGLPFNRRLGAYNVFEIPIDTTLVGTAGALYGQHIGPRLGDTQGSFRSGEFAFYVKRPQGWSSDISWWSADDEPTYHWFETALFQRVDLRPIASLVDVDHSLRLYAPSFVVRSRCERPRFHKDYDWRFGTNAYTLMTPLHDMPAVGEGHLVYIDVWGRRCVYRYRKGLAIVFGTGFIHGTQRLVSGPPRSFLCFTFGSDKAKYWPYVQSSVATQSRLVCHPTGAFIAGDPTAQY